ncbi:MAG: gliding motility-associated C-terminal domain-containing protein [Bacteroidetes bacterium]|nr:gliding motility-associated C-terminal domain-containing protein [Bacteroidota bacterium]
MRIISLSGFIFLLFISCIVHSQNWQTKPFEQKVFIENKGQFDGMNNLKNSHIKYAVVNEGVAIYFTNTGLTYRHDEYEKQNEGEEEAAKLISHFVQMEWEGANPDAEIISEDAASCYFTYPTIKASAVKKIIYKNIYPNIDVEYFFPEGKTGIKYSLILHSGANASLIKMKYSDVKGLATDIDGNVRIETSFGNFIDHAPEAFYENNHQTVSAAFSISNNVVSFSFPNGEGRDGASIIIDPWTTNPSFPGYNSAYDIDYDYAGNVYVYGGQGSPSNPLQEIKFNSAGAIQWVYSATPMWLYGDFAVDANSGSSYIGEGYNFNLNNNVPAQMIKVNSVGSQIILYPGNPNMKEIWRIAYNSCTKQGVIGGSGWNTSYEAAILDTTLTSMNPVNVLSPAGLDDVDNLALDNSGNCFMGFSKSGSMANNTLVKTSASALFPVTYNVPSNFQMNEISGINYVNGTTGTNGMNGIAVNGNYLYTYNSSKIKRYNKNTGAPIDSAVITPPVYCCFPSYDRLVISWGGIAVDECDNIFIGSHDTIFQIDTNYNKITFIPANGDVYDLKLGPGNLLYACGKNFVSSFPSGVSCNSLNVSVSASGSCAASSATVTVTGGSAPYTYSWSPGGQTTAIATGLSSGTYTVTVSDASSVCISGGNVQTATVTITSGALTVSVTSTPAACLSSNGTATVTPTGGTSPYTYSWSPSGGTNAIATGLSAGAYTVTVTDASGCSGTSTVTINSSGGPIISLSNQTNILCNGGNNGSASVTASGGTSPYIFSWSPSGGTTSAATGLSAGNYTATVTDANGCTNTQTVIITQPTALTSNITSTTTACAGNNGSATVFAGGGISPYTYAWSPSGGNSSTATGLGAGNYTAAITDANGCTNTATVTVTSTGGPTANVSVNVTITSGSSTTLTATGGGTYTWSNGANSSAITVNPAVTTIYCVTVTDANNCSDTACVTVTVMVEPLNCGYADDQLFVPDAFSPNGDTKNDRMEVYYPNSGCIKEFMLIIYNRWGEKVFEADNITVLWDGTYKGKQMNTAVFVYYMKVTFITGNETVRKGNVSLIR